jgi:hypothetical protein
MARIALGLLALALLLGATGCTWTETYRDYPPRLSGTAPHADHPHPHVMSE